MSTEQGNNHSTTDQVKEVTSDEANTQSQNNDNWGKVDMSDYVSKEEYKKLQWQYTKSRQEISEITKKNEMSDEDKAAYDLMKGMDFMTKADLEAQAANIARESNLKDIISWNPNLKQFESAIRKIWANENIAYEDIIQDYGFWSKDKLAKARSQWDVKWMPNEQTKKKSIGEMSSVEYANWKKEKWLGNNTWSFSN